jgi:hypothetical protein
MCIMGAGNLFQVQMESILPAAVADIVSARWIARQGTHDVRDEASNADHDADRSDTDNRYRARVALNAKNRPAIATAVRGCAAEHTLARRVCANAG